MENDHTGTYNLNSIPLHFFKPNEHSSKMFGGDDTAAQIYDALKNTRLFNMDLNLVLCKPDHLNLPNNYYLCSISFLLSLPPSPPEPANLFCREKKKLTERLIMNVTPDNIKTIINTICVKWPVIQTNFKAFLPFVSKVVKIDKDGKIILVNNATIAPQYTSGEYKLMDIESLREPSYITVFNEQNEWKLPLETIKLQQFKKGEVGWNRDLFIPDYYINIDTIFNRLIMKIKDGNLTLLKGSGIPLQFGVCPLLSDETFTKTKNVNLISYICMDNSSTSSDSFTGGVGGLVSIPKPPPPPEYNNSDNTIQNKLIILILSVILIPIISFVLGFYIIKKFTSKKSGVSKRLKK